MMKSKKKVFIPILVLLMIAITGGTILAAMPRGYEKNFLWASTFRTNSINSYYPSETRLIQRAISSIMIPGFTVDGIFGPDTDKKVRDYQGHRGLTKDGKVGPNTWNDFQTYPIWSQSSTIWDNDRGMYYYQYKTIHDSEYYIRHYSNGVWYVKASNKVWYRVN